MKTHKLIPTGSHVHVIIDGDVIICCYVVDELRVKEDGPIIGRYFIMTKDENLYDVVAQYVFDMQDGTKDFNEVVPQSWRCPACNQSSWRNHTEDCPWWDMMREIGYIGE
jgi:hypothetical protein